MRDLFFEIHADVIAEAASSFDGHVTHGSLDALLKCFEDLMDKRLHLFALGVIADLKTNGKLQFDHPLAKDIVDAARGMK